MNSEFGIKYKTILLQNISFINLFMHIFILYCIQFSNFKFPPKIIPLNRLHAIFNNKYLMCISLMKIKNSFI